MPCKSQHSLTTITRTRFLAALQIGAWCFLTSSQPAWPDGLRCGTRLVVNGDPISRLMKACGQPQVKLRSRTDIGRRGNTQEVAVTQWVYTRPGRADMIVSIRSGRVVKIERG